MTPDITLPELVTASELATYLRTDQRRVYQMTNEGRVPFYEVGGRKRYIVTEVLEALRREPTRPTNPVERDAVRTGQSVDPSHLKLRLEVPL